VHTALWQGGGDVGGFSSFLGVVGRVGPCMGGIFDCSTLGNKMSSTLSSLPLVRVGDGTHIGGMAGGLGSIYTG
jgi:hypothetical protein